MSRITKAMLEEEIEIHKGVRRMQCHKIELLTKEVELLRSSFTNPGYMAALAVAAERLGEALAHVVSDLKKRP